MKALTLHICLLISFGLGAQNTRLSSTVKPRYKYPMSHYEKLAKLQENQELRDFKRVQFLQEVKYLIINGRLEKAKIMLREATLSDDFTKTTQIRYLAMINFIQNNHKEVIKLLNSKPMQNFGTLSKHCLMNIMSLIILKKTELVKLKWKDCKAVALTKSENSLAWMQVLVNLSTQDPKKSIDDIFKEVSLENLDKENLRILLKLALYLNQQDKIIPRFSLLDEQILSNTGFRELIGMNYFRNLDLVKAYQLLEDLETPNSEVFKGNIYLTQKNYLKAYAQYKLALNKKDNSDNALERLIPLAWKLRQWEEGLEYVKRFHFNKDALYYKYTLIAAYATMSDQFNITDDMIRRIRSSNIQREPLEIQQIVTLSSLYKKDENALDDSALTNCLNKDALHCWLLYYKSTWAAPVENLLSDHSLHKSTSITDYYSEKIIEEPIDQPIFVNQKDIEQLDNELIELIQN